MIERIENPETKKTVARKVLEALRDWFGIDESREQYIAGSADGRRPDRDEILSTIAFQEQYYMGELYECPDQEVPIKQEEADR